MISHHSPIKAICIGTSAGGVLALNILFRSLPDYFKVPIIVILHVGDNAFIPKAFHAPKGVIIKEADEKEEIKPGFIYFAPSGYHLLIESDFTFSLTVEDKVQYARPSLDVTMDTAAQAYGPSLLGIVLTGANEDGADGLLAIKDYKGLTIVQAPEGADYETMPRAALKKVEPDFILSVPEIGTFITQLEGSL